MLMTVIMMIMILALHRKRKGRSLKSELTLCCFSVALQDIASCPDIENIDIDHNQLYGNDDHDHDGIDDHDGDDNHNSR